MNRRKILIAACLLLAAVVPGYAAGIGPGPIDWLQEVTDQITALMNNQSDALVDLGVIELNFIAIITLIGIVVRWQLSHMVIGFHPVNFTIGDFFVFLLNFAFCSVLLHYYNNPLPGVGVNFHQLPAGFSILISSKLGTAAIDQMLAQVSDAISKTQKPSVTDLLGIIVYAVTMAQLAALQFVMFALNSFGYIGQAMFALFGPLLIPLYMTKRFAGKFFAWLDGLIVFSMFGAVSTGLSFIWLNVIVGFFQNTVAGDYTIGHWFAVLTTLVMITCAFLYSMFKIPSITAALFGGSAALAQGFAETLTARAAGLAMAVYRG